MPIESFPRKPETSKSLRNFFTTLAISISILLNPTNSKAMEEIDGLSSEKLMSLINRAEINKKSDFSSPIEIEVTDTNIDIFSGYKIGDKVICNAEVKTDEEGHVDVKIIYLDNEGEEIIISNK